MIRIKQNKISNFLILFALIITFFLTTSRIFSQNVSVLSDCFGVITNVSFTGDANQISSYSGYNFLGLDSGIVLSSGNVSDLNGGSIGITNNLTDIDLLTLANSVPPLINQSFNVTSVNDVATIEFDFIANSDSINFGFIFASNEYLAYINSAFNDVFGLFLSGPGINGTYSNNAINLATIPNSSPPLAVTVSSVNNILNSNYYINNPNNTYINVNGYTHPMFVSYPVTNGLTYHFKFTIGDGSDSAINSYIFLGDCQAVNTILGYGGCTDPLAFNYDPNASANDGSCCFLSGCIDSIAINYDSFACYDNGSCIYNFGCTDNTAINYDSLATTDDGSCIYCNVTVRDTFFYFGAMQTFTVPFGVTSVDIDMTGGSGGNGTSSANAGAGGRLEATLAVNTGQVLNIFVGDQGGNAAVGVGGTGGYNGGGSGGSGYSNYAGGGGGGSSDIRVGGVNLNDRVLISGGGGGAGNNCFGTDYGGNGGDLSADDGWGCGNYSDGGSGKGGTQIIGGLGGSWSGWDSGMSGSLGFGGNAGFNTAGGGGGGGYFGGGGASWSGGGGGSSYTDIFVSNIVNTLGYNFGSGLVVISYSTQTCTGCTDPIAINYDSTALYDDGNCCYLAGCTNQQANNYNQSACYDDGTCCYISGCTNPLANNYNSLACFDDGSCIYNFGCIDPFALNYDPSAILSDGSCCYISGCIDSLANNYDSLACFDSGNCTYNYGCTNPQAFNYDPLAFFDDGNCCFLSGCTNNIAINYDSLVCFDDGSCVYIYGCTDPTALNFNVLATMDDGSCLLCDQNIIDTFQFTGFTQTYTVPNGVTNLSIQVFGAQGATGMPNNYSGGLGAKVSGDFSVISGETFTLLVGGQGKNDGYGSAGGGGGSFVVDSFNNPIIIAGGGGGIRFGANQNGNPGVIDNWGTTGSESYSTGGGTSNSSNLGYGGSVLSTEWYGSAGGGFYSNGMNDIDTNGVMYGFGGVSFLNGGFTQNNIATGNCFNSSADGGYGGGGQGNGCNGGGGGGGYTGGDGGYIAGGGGSFNTGDNQENYSGIKYGDGLIVISYSTSCIGCTDPTAINYNLFAFLDDSSCITCDISSTVSVMNASSPTNCDGFVFVNSLSSYPPLNYTWFDSSSTVIEDTNDYVSNLCFSTYYLEVTDSVGCSTNDTLILYDYYGCTDSTAFNYDSLTLYDDGSCIPYIFGCTDSTMTNYNFLANTDDGSCIPFNCDLVSSFIVMQESSSTACDGWIFINSNSTNYPITYLWNSGLTNNNILNLCSGVYNVIISDALGCIIDTSIIIGNPSVLGCTDPLASNYDSSANTDDGSCTYSTVCTEPTPTGLFTSNIVHNRATINWDNMNDANCTVDQYRIKYREVGTNSWSQKNMCTPLGSCTWACNKTDKLILGLNPGTTYEYQIRAWYCGAGNSAWSSLNTFTTLDACPNVGNLTVSTPNTTKATFNWDASNGVYEFVRIKMRVDGIVNPISSDWFNVGGAGVSYPTFTKNKNNLTPGETYRAQARTWCDPNGGAYKSDTWTPLVYWTQPTIRIEGGESIANLEVYPNPSNDVFNISFTSESIQDLRVRVLSIVGEELIVEDLQKFIGEYTKKVSLNENANGIYFLEIETKDGVINKKLILQ